MTPQTLLEVAGLPVTPENVARLRESPTPTGEQFYLQSANGDNFAGPYDTEDEAEQAHHKLLQKAFKQRYSEEEKDNIANMKIVKM